MTRRCTTPRTRSTSKRSADSNFQAQPPTSQFRNMHETAPRKNGPASEPLCPLDVRVLEHLERVVVEEGATVGADPTQDRVVQGFLHLVRVPRIEIDAEEPVGEEDEA